MAEEIQVGSSGYPLTFLMIDSSDHIAGKIGLSPTVKLSKRGAAGVTPAGTVAEIDSTNEPGWYKVTSHPLDVGTLGPLILHATATGADPADEKYIVVAYNPENSGSLGLTSLPAVLPGVNSGIALVNASNQVNLNPLQTFPTGKLDNSLAQCLIFAQAQGGGNWTFNTGVSPARLTLFAMDGTTPLFGFNIDSITNPTRRY